MRARDYSTRSLLTYLKSRANAGCTADDLVEGVRVLTAGRCVLNPHPNRHPELVEGVRVLTAGRCVLNPHPNPHPDLVEGVRGASPTSSPQDHGLLSSHSSLPDDSRMTPG